MIRSLIFFALTGLISLSVASSEKPTPDKPQAYNEPIKPEYRLGYAKFVKTDQTGDGYSVICDVGQALPNPSREGWYTNKQIYGLTFELRGRLVFENFAGKLTNM